MSTFRSLRHLNRHYVTPINFNRTTLQSRRWKSTEVPKDPIDELLDSKPSWSVRALLPSASDAPDSTVTPAQLHHLLRLSALPQPESPEEEEEMLKTLQTQLHFVKEIQSVDTTGVEPLQAIRDETEQGVKENTIGLASLEKALADEEIKGRNRRPRRKRDATLEHYKTTDEDSWGEYNEVREWDVLGTAKRTVGKFFVVKNSKD